MFRAADADIGWLDEHKCSCSGELIGSQFDCFNIYLTGRVAISTIRN